MRDVTQLFDVRNKSVSITAREIAVLNVINRNTETGICVADISSEIAEAIGHEPRLTTVYDTVVGMEKKGLIKEKGLGGDFGRPRSLYILTDLGASSLDVGVRLSKSILTA